MIRGKHNLKNAIAGGKDKGTDFSPLAETVRRKVKLAVLIGETRERMKEVFKLRTDVKLFSDIASAVHTALDSAGEGDFILFSPGCSSFDMFSSYVERGEVFNRLVRERAGVIVNLVTSLLLSIILTVILNLILGMKR